MISDFHPEATMRTKAGERFSTEVTLTPEMVAGFARDVGDDNPVHHDPEFAAGTRFRRLIASGTHTTALLLALTAKHFSKRGAMLGLEFWQRFRKPVYADETIRLEWLVVRVTPNAALRGDVVELRGRIQGADGRTAVGAKGRVLVTDAL
jgi:acyl dehydratase